MESFDSPVVNRYESGLQKATECDAVVEQVADPLAEFARRRLVALMRVCPCDELAEDRFAPLLSCRQRRGLVEGTRLPRNIFRMLSNTKQRLVIPRCVVTRGLCHCHCLGLCLFAFKAIFEDRRGGFNGHQLGYDGSYQLSLRNQLSYVTRIVAIHLWIHGWR